MKYLVFLFLLGCSTAQPVTCASELNEKQDFLKNSESNTKCNCSCPTQPNNLANIFGILGGIFSWSQNS